MNRLARAAAGTILCLAAYWLGAASPEVHAAEVPKVAVEAQPLGANLRRLSEALEYLGAPLDVATARALEDAIRAQDAAAMQAAIDRHVLVTVAINPESRVKVTRGEAPAILQQAGWTPAVVKVVNEGTVTKRLSIGSPQAGSAYAGVSELSMKRQQQEQLRANENVNRDPDRFLVAEMFRDPPMTPDLSGLEVEYAIALIYSSDAGKREATLAFDVGQGTQDLGFRGETPVLFNVRRAVPVRISVRDHDGAPTVAKLTIRDKLGHVYPPQPRRLAPDLFFQPHIYRADGETILLPPGTFRVESSRGPEYIVREAELSVDERPGQEWRFQLERWINPAERGFYSGDHHIHAAGCAHYESPTEGIGPADVFRQVKGEGLNVGCVLTWGYCFDYQQQFFSPRAADISEPFTALKYDLEISGFGSQALGHVCLLNLAEQRYPGTIGIQGWPTWNTPVLKWARGQGGVVGFAHSASGLQIVPDSAARWTLRRGDRDGDGLLDAGEARHVVLPYPFDEIDRDRDGRLDRAELAVAADRAADELPNLVIPEMNGVGAMEICVALSEGACDFISAMDTERIQEWNTWYHLLNCGFPLKAAGETDFPCMSGTRVGQGRTYVQLGPVGRIDVGDWCRGLRDGRSYISDGYAHALAFEVNGVAPGFGNVARAGNVRVKAEVAFAPETPRAIAHGTAESGAGRRVLGDTRTLHGARLEDRVQGGRRLVELIVNGKVAATREVPADGMAHALEFDIPIKQSSWVALRHFPQLHTNPVTVLVADRPIRASVDSARWCQEMTRRLWANRRERISEAERPAAQGAFERTYQRFERIAEETAQQIGSDNLDNGAP